MLIAGLDEAGRGPVIGPLVIGCAIIAHDKLDILEEIGVDDSKKLSPKKRASMAQKIKEVVDFWDVLVISPTEINHLHDEQKLTLNQIEETNFAKLLNNVKNKPDEIFLDACDVKEDRFGRTIGSMLQFSPQKIISKHKGDSIFKVVGAASILAKYERDLILASYTEKYGRVGSGYPSDPYTKKFLDEYYQQHKNFPPIVRTWWKTAENIVNKYNIKKKQTKLTDF
ncbi:Ribonuclease HII [Candidatus Lokiarchaeum ossiferum]|uniref:Ribonuclease HII n=1 Tax=Candidatus Lokiarchaeum ossiferum TaxID=2951803 RepID=A0ABY6HR36_9ARCH|nr:Ribonuclease HII [Candidatus Lokiarchaeum sp. B-35]